MPGNELAGCGTCAPGHFNDNAIQFADDVDTIHGRNRWSFGGEWMHLQLNELGGFKTNSQISFNGVSSGDPWSDFLLGLPNDFTQGNPEQENWRQNYIGLYVQDNFQATQSLNVHLGLRWEPYLPETNKFGRGNYFSFAGFEAGKKTSKYTNAPPGLFYVGVSTMLTSGRSWQETLFRIPPIRRRTTATAVSITARFSTCRSLPSPRNSAGFGLTGYLADGSLRRL